MKKKCKIEMCSVPAVCAGQAGQLRNRAASRSALKGLHTMRPGSTTRPGEPAAFRCLQVRSPVKHAHHSTI